MTDFEIILEKMKKILGVDKDAEVAGLIGMKPSAFANRKKSGSIPYSHYVTAAKAHNVNLNWLIYGDGPMFIDKPRRVEETNVVYSDEDVTSKSNSPIIIQHIDLVKEFEDPEEALEANRNLITLEKLDPEEYYATTGRLRGTVKKLLKKKDASMESDDPDQIIIRSSKKIQKKTT